jgi:hypothetical protein
MSIPISPDFVSNPDGWFGDALLLGALTAGALAVEHAMLWDEPQRLKPPASYVVGVATLGIGLLGWVDRHRKANALTTWLAATVITAIGGGTVIVCYYGRDLRDQLQRSGERGGQIQGRIGALLGQEKNDGHHRTASGDHLS